MPVPAGHSRIRGVVGRRKEEGGVEGGRCGDRDRKWIDREREAVTFENGFQELTAFAR